ncbi:MAG: hypothetical protein EI684_17410 [Candidatus Viridilinea halotolerans]|uniref:Uncharacterized protein n=1 Tax=Candidatus Viridilinea halotolerans TaxID=2491704 RepID=A0A426TU28_9CHLR|nr:MAG: hypothetical protein EI684_17410 [Candidatus Viridilinea halotolerans]
MSKAEFHELQASRTFRMHSSSAEGKYFAERPEHAAKWGDLMEGPGNYYVVSGEVLLDVPAYQWQKLDGIGPTRFYEADQLSQIRYTGEIR